MAEEHDPATAKNPAATGESFLRELGAQGQGDVRKLQAERRIAVNRSPVSELAVAAARDAAVRSLDGDGNFLALSDIELLDPYYALEFRRSGVQHGVFRKLKQGKYAMDARLDLHRLTVERARDEVFGFIRDALAYDLRNVMIVTGRGNHSQSAEAILKSYVNRWLPDFEEVQAYCSAQPQHGGTGAVYVMLRKSEKQREANRIAFSRGRVEIK
ncbi:MAG: DNA endonuclease SmrA [Spongiibacteraceae bacterium]